MTFACGEGLRINLDTKTSWHRTPRQNRTNLINVENCNRGGPHVKAFHRGPSGAPATHTTSTLENPTLVIHVPVLLQRLVLHGDDHTGGLPNMDNQCYAMPLTVKAMQC